ncbi:MAG: hypothetical protein H7145_09155 [Akkermansiaceae bacterium]|nr:hypothetical protein [Armatimonadota bacterium]
MGNYSVRTQTESDAILTLATEAMEAKMNAGEPFTALDISNVLKAKNLPVRHREVAAVVRGLYVGGGMGAFGYVRDLIHVSTPDGSAQAYLYRHGTQDPSDYTLDAQDALPPVPADRARPLDDAVPAGGPLSTLAETALQGMVGSAVISGGGSTAYGVPSPRRSRGAFRRDGAVAVPRSFIEQAGYQVGDLLMLTHDAQTDTLALQAVAPGTTVIGAFVKVWGDLRVRIAKTKLRIAGCAVPVQKPSFALDGGSLRIEP